MGSQLKQEDRMILAGYVLSFKFQFKSVWLAWELLTRRGSLSMFLQRRRLVQRSVQWCLHSLLCGAPLHTNSPQSFSNSISSLCQWRRRALQTCESEHTLRSPHAFRRIKLPCADNSDGEIRTRVESHGLWGEVKEQLCVWVYQESIDPKCIPRISVTGVCCA